MPVADFAGRWNWGYDGVDLFAPSRAYGTPGRSARARRRAHGLGLAVLLDVVYNHFGPDGNYLARLQPRLLLVPTTSTPWGDALNLDGEDNAIVREFVSTTPCTGSHDTTSTACASTRPTRIIDDSPRHFLAEIQTARPRSGTDAPCPVSPKTSAQPRTA